MFLPDELLVQRARVALDGVAPGHAVAISGPLPEAYDRLRLAVFEGEDGKRMASEARTARRVVDDDRTYLVIVDLSRSLDRDDVLLVEPT